MNDVLLSPLEIRRLNEIIKLSPDRSIRKRAEIILLYYQGLPTSQIATRVELSRSRVRYWRRAYRQKGWGIFRHANLQQVSEDEQAQAGLEVVGQAAAPGEESPTSGRISQAYEMGEAQPKQPSEDLPDRETDLLEDASVEESALESPISLTALQNTHQADLGRAQHIHALALKLFDETQTRHQIDQRYRRILSAAAQLVSLKNKAKASQQAILAQPLIDFNEKEREVVAVLVRRQTDYRSKRKLNGVGSGSKDDRDAQGLLAIFHIACALNTSNSQTTQIVEIVSDEENLTIHVDGPQALVDLTAAQPASRLWSDLYLQSVHLSSASMDMDAIRELSQTLSAPGVHPDDSMAEAGRKVLRYHFLQMLAHENGTRLGEDIEELHDMRVATRRMRAAFDVFGDYFDPKKTRQHRRGLRAAGRALGRVRDLDVFMEKAEHYLDTLPEMERRGLQPLLGAWSSEREAARAEMLAHLDSPEYQVFVERFNEFLRLPGEGAQVLPETAPQRARDVAPVLIYTRLAAVRAYAAVLDHAPIEQLHALRIEFKRLRYTVEYFREILAPESRAVIDEIKIMQDHLGDLNDADVACSILNDFLAGWEQSQSSLSLVERQNPEPMVNYLAAKHAERHRLLVELPAAWARFNRPEIRQYLAQAIAIL